MAFKGPFQLKLFYDSMIWACAGAWQRSTALAGVPLVLSKTSDSLNLQEPSLCWFDFQRNFPYVFQAWEEEKEACKL